MPDPCASLRREAIPAARSNRPTPSAAEEMRARSCVTPPLARARPNAPPAAVIRMMGPASPMAPPKEPRSCRTGARWVFQSTKAAANAARKSAAFRWPRTAAHAAPGIAPPAAAADAPLMSTTGNAIGNTEAMRPGRPPGSVFGPGRSLPSGSTVIPRANRGAARSVAAVGRIPSSSPNPMAVPRSSPRLSAIPSGPGVGGTSE